ncbi:ABC transporter permease [Romboutsia lituseburensis]|uniref:ABC transporter permease n=1 Tax=Romboutsia lituseburensis TaxID=1537 RepID=UPI00215ADABA|nr:ABC transporter permease [Romboutsia lituseburensis]MCR8744721.1 ABC transporter permease [Romboutsia lituseburensis]
MNLIKSSLSNLKGHKLRVFITLLWIIMGITSVILVSSIGNGLKKEVFSSVDKVNPNKTRISFEPTDQNMSSMTAFLQPFALKDIEELSFVEGVERIGPAKEDFDMNSSYFSEASFDKKTTSIEVNELKKDTKVKASYGRNFSLEDNDRKVIMITMQNATDLFGDAEKAIGKGITISGSTFEVIGVVDESSLTTNTEENNSGMIAGMYSGDFTYATSYMPKKSFDSLMNQYSYPTEIYGLDLIVSKGYDVSEVAYRVCDKLYDLHPDIDGSYNPQDPSEQTQELEAMVSKINLFITAITAISMFVGGVGVMNIMYVSVMERQREIGIRRAIGAKPRHILFQFLTEAVFITVCGGILGIIIGFIVVNYASNYLPFKAIPNANSLFYAFIATVLTGIVFGIVPALKASKLDPIKAIYK